jgi:hypothetical protein
MMALLRRSYPIRLRMDLWVIRMVMSPRSKLLAVRPANMKRKRNSTQGTSGGSTTGVYCTQKYLLSLKRRHVLDRACPSYHLHHQHSTSRLHPINVASFHQLVQAQLTADMDHHCDPLGRQGARRRYSGLPLPLMDTNLWGKGQLKLSFKSFAMRERCTMF